MARVLVPSKPCRPNRSSAHRSKISGESVSLAMYVTCSFDVNARWRDGSRVCLSQLSRPDVRRVDCGVVPSRAPIAADATTFARSAATKLICCPMNANLHDWRSRRCRYAIEESRKNREWEIDRYHGVP